MSYLLQSKRTGHKISVKSGESTALKTNYIYKDSWSVLILLIMINRNSFYFFELYYILKLCSMAFFYNCISDTV